jgi:hypothetical protein
VENVPTTVLLGWFSATLAAERPMSVGGAGLKSVITGVATKNSLLQMPSWPSKLPPQHWTSPALVRSQL